MLLLLQVWQPDSHAPAEMQPLRCFYSQKLSLAAQNWANIQQEGYGIIVGTVKFFSYELRGKAFLPPRDGPQQPGLYRKVP